MGNPRKISCGWPAARAVVLGLMVCLGVGVMSGVAWAADAVAVTVVRDVAYVADGSEAQRLDVFVPEHATGAKLPAIVWIHGGGWHGGDKGRPFPVRDFTQRGYVVASVNYRLTGEARFPAQIHDCKAAIRFLRAHADEYAIDGDRIGVAGSSAGGHLVALLGTTNGDAALEGELGHNAMSSNVAAVCAIAAPSNFLAERYRKQTPRAVVALFGGTIEEKLDLATQASPLQQVSSDDVPMLLIHGEQDKLVPAAMSVDLDEALREAGVESTLVLLPTMGHGVSSLRLKERKALEVQVAGFFAKWLGGGE